MVHSRRNHPLAAAQTLAALQGAQWAVGPSVSGPVDVLSEAFAVRRMAAPRVAAKCPDFTSMLNLVAHTDLLAGVPHAALLMGDLRKQVAPLRLRETLPLYEMGWFHPARSRRAAAVVAALRLKLEIGARKT